MGQLQMAEAIEAAFADKKHLIVEAGTGTGKTLSYLVPAILAGKRVVISTGTKNLQEQLYFRDIPFLQRHFSQPLRIAYMKGRANYACRQKIYDAAKEPVLNGLEEIADFQVIQEWEKTTETGDRAEIKTLPEGSSAWNKIDARRELCTGQKCLQFERCFVTQMHQRAAESDIVIVNHHLFFADLAVKENEQASIIPEYGAVIFDEAHDIEDVAGQYFGRTVSNYQVTELVRDALAISRRKEFGSKELDGILAVLQDRSELFFGLFGHTDGRIGFHAHQTFGEKHASEIGDIRGALGSLASHLKLLLNAPEEAIPLIRRAEEIAAGIEFFTRGDSHDYVYWIERRSRGCFLRATPIDVHALLERKLFDRVNTIVLTSATLAVSGTFEYAEKRLGLRNPRTLIVTSHFDYQKQALLYIPQQLPDPRSSGFSAAAAREITRILEASRGRAFVLFTSNQQMRTLYDRVSLNIEYPTLLQGTGPRSALLEEFRSTPNCVLFATSSFWQGVDVQGEQLSCVIVDKLPFAVPGDPVIQARIESIRQDGGNPFHDFQIPQAALALKQGFGRLIRSQSDRGVLALLDNRITSQRYGQIFFDSLPDYAFTTQFDEVEQFFHV